MNKIEMQEQGQIFCAQLEKLNLGGFFVLVDKGGVMSVHSLPPWGVLNLNEEKKTMTMTGLENQTLEEWLKQLELSSYYLEAVRQNCQKSADMMNEVQSELKKMLDECMKELKTTDQVSNVTRIH
jgi:hypothetical protein